jgi:hypothetical protein
MDIVAVYLKFTALFHKYSQVQISIIGLVPAVTLSLYPQNAFVLCPSLDVYFVFNFFEDIAGS